MNRVARGFVFKPKIPIWVNVGGPYLQWKMLAELYGLLEYFTAIWYIIWPFGNIMVIWYIFPRFVIFCPEKSGNPADEE
jgi:hypothetical protein